MVSWCPVLTDRHADLSQFIFLKGNGEVDLSGEPVTILAGPHRRTTELTGSTSQAAKLTAEVVVTAVCSLCLKVELCKASSLTSCRREHQCWLLACSLQLAPSWGTVVSIPSVVPSSLGNRHLPRVSDQPWKEPVISWGMICHLCIVP